MGGDRPLADWVPPPAPGPEALQGRYARLERLRPDHARLLFDANRLDDRIWDHLPYGPFHRLEDYLSWMAATASGPDPMFYAIRDEDTGRWGGVASWLRIAPAAGSIEVGHICLAPPLQRRPAATEAMALMMRWAFESGYRRYEWKCDSRNRASRRAAQRLGLSFEGVFRQAGVIKGRNRDTAWFAAIDSEWPALEAAFDAWLDPSNFDVEGRQRARLSDLTAPILVARDPGLPG